MNEKLTNSSQKMLTQKERLDTARKNKNLSQAQLYDLLFPDNDKSYDYKKAYIAMWNKRGIANNHIDEVARILGVTVGWLSGTDPYMNLPEKLSSTTNEVYSDTISNIEFFIQILKWSGHKMKPLKSADMKHIELIDEDSSGIFGSTIQHAFEDCKLDQNEYIFAVQIDNNVYDIGTLEKLINATLSNIETITDNTLLVAKRLRPKK